MAITLRITVQPGVLFVLAQGEFSLDEAKQSFLDIIDSMEQNQSRKVLFDGREITGMVDVIERFYYGEFMAAALDRLKKSSRYDGNPQFAYVLREPILDPLRLGETVAVNRGANVKVFDNVREAREWLDL